MVKNENENDDVRGPGAQLLLASDPGLAVLAEGLVAAARAQGVQLTGPGGLLTGLTKQVLETALQVEMAEHLGYEPGDPSGYGSGNSRNGTTAKTVRTDVGEVRIEVPRDRAGTFAPVVVGKHQRRLAGFDAAVLSLYAKGMTTGDIANHLGDIYGTDVSRELVSKVTDAVVADMTEWQSRPLDRGRLPGGAGRRDRAQNPRRAGRQPAGLCGDGHHRRRIA